MDLGDHKARFALIIAGALNVFLFALGASTDVFDNIPSPFPPAGGHPGRALRGAGHLRPHPGHRVPAPAPGAALRPLLRRHRRVRGVPAGPALLRGRPEPGHGGLPAGVAGRPHRAAQQRDRRPGPRDLRDRAGQVRGTRPPLPRAPAHGGLRGGAAADRHGLHLPQQGPEAPAQEERHARRHRPRSGRAGRCLLRAATDHRLRREGALRGGLRSAAGPRCSRSATTAPWRSSTWRATGSTPAPSRATSRTWPCTSPAGTSCSSWSRSRR